MELANHMKIDSKLSRLFFVSPWFFLLFFIIPLIVILSFLLHMPLPLASSKYPLLANNVCFSLFVLIRFFYYLAGLKKKIRYGSESGVPRRFTKVALSMDSARTSLEAAGYLFDTGGSYGEKHDYGYVGSVILYAGFFIVLFTGSLDNLYQFSGTVQYGVGSPIDLRKITVFNKVSVGPATSDLSTLPQMRIVKQFFPSATYPKGAIEAIFKLSDGKEQQVILKSPEPFRVGAYDIYMSKMVYEPEISITINDSNTVFRGKVILEQLPVNDNNFGFYGTFIDGLITGKVYFQPEKSLLKVIVNQGALLLLDTELVFQSDRLSKSANFAVTCEKMGVWSEIYVVHGRHMSVIFFGAALTFVGIFIRVLFRPQRVWLMEAQEGSVFRSVGKDAEKQLMVDDFQKVQFS